MEHEMEVGEIEKGSQKKPSAGRANFAAVLRHSDFRKLWLGQIISQIGDYFAFLGMIVIIAGLSKDLATTTAATSGFMIAFTLPRLLFGVLAGVFVDRWDRRLTMLVSDVLRAILSLALIWAFLSRSLALMYILGFVLSSVGTFFNPAKGALIPNLVPQEQLMSANALSQTSQMLATFIGPALAGGVFALVGDGNQWIAFVIDSLTFVTSAAAIYLIRARDEPGIQGQALDTGAEVGRVKRVWQELVIGLKILVLNRTVATLALVSAITFLGVGAINVLWIVFLKTNFGFESTELAWRISIVDIAFSAGMVAASVAAGNFLSHLRPKWFLVWGLLGAGIGTTVIGYLPNYWSVIPVMAFVGAAVAPISTGTMTLMQIVVPNRQLGRVGGGLGTVTDVAMLLSVSLAAGLGGAFGIPVVFMLGGVMCMLSGLVAWAFLPGLTLKDKVEEDQDLRQDRAATSDNAGKVAQPSLARANMAE